MTQLTLTPARPVVIERRFKDAARVGIFNARAVLAAHRPPDERSMRRHADARRALATTTTKTRTTQGAHP